MKPKVSVIVPIYNVEKYLEQCLDSILSQTLNDIEVICINDGSPDNSLSILKNYAKKDKRVCIIDKENGGYGAACNCGIKASKGEYIGIVEPDDFISKYMYETLYVFAKSFKADVVKSPFYEYNDADDKNPQRANKVDWEEQFAFPLNPFTINDCPAFFYFHPSIWSCIYKKSFLTKNKIKFVEARGAGWVDNPFQVDTLCSAASIVWCPEPYYFYRHENPESSSYLKDCTIPFDRCDEMHRILEDKKISNESIYAWLYKRELGYIDIVLECLKHNEDILIYKRIDDMVKRMNGAVLYSNPNITKHEKMLYEQMLNKNYSPVSAV